MDAQLYNNYLEILRKELVPAMGCTEPISLAYGAALAKKYLREEVLEVDLLLSTNIIKNVKSVTVPNTGGLKGINAAVAVGILFGDADRKLEVISRVNECSNPLILDFIEKHPFTLNESKLGSPFDYMVTLKGANHFSTVRIVGDHTNVCLIKTDEEIIFEKSFDNYKEEVKVDRSCLNVEDIVKFADTVDLNDVREILNRQIKYNMNIATEGLVKPYGARIGQILMSSGTPSILNKAKAYAASASDARMSGCDLPVIINSGSGNQGITASVPVIVYARELKLSTDLLLRALVVSNLITIHLKTGIGRLSAYCGVISAAAGAACGISYLHGGRFYEISHIIVNTLAIDSGVICDGAKASCAAKIASAIETSILAMNMINHGSQFRDGEGIVTKGVENTIKNIGKIANDGMRKTDEEIIDIMIHNC